LTEILVRELVELQVDDQIAAEEPIVEDEVEEVVVAVECEPLLARFEEEALAEFEEKFFQMRDDGGFEFGFGVAGLFVEAEEFEDEGFFEEVVGLGDDLTLPGEAFYAVLVAAEGDAFVEAGGFLASEFRHGPAFVGGLDFVETALVGVLDGEEFDVVGPAQGEGAGEFCRRFLLNVERGHFPRQCLGDRA
jgi:hypothetical protein